VQHNAVSLLWKSIQGVTSPFPSRDPKTFGYWFNYLWEEARQSDGLTDGEKARLCDAFFAVLSSSGTTYRPCAEFATMSNEQKQRVLASLLVYGFKRVPLPGTVTARTGASRTVNAGEIFATKMEYLRRGVPNTVHLGFRADGRTYKQLIAQGGFRARARSRGQDVHSNYGLNEPWNPFSLHVYANSLFLRKGENKDNCLHTVVSVGLEFAELLPYPLLSDASLFRWAKKPFKEWTTADEQQARQHRYAVRTVHKTSGGPIDHLESEVRIFVLRMGSASAFSTQAWQKKVGVPNPFPEAAVNEVSADDILAEVEVTRRHYFDGRALTFYDFEISQTRILDREGLAARYGRHFPSALEQRIQSLKGAAKNTWSSAKAQYVKYNTPKTPGTGPKKDRCPKCDKSYTPIMMNRHGC
jgi:hypothetical protein